MKISVVGCGRWGTFIAWYLNKKFEDVTLLGRHSSDKFQQLIKTRQNEYVKLPEELKLSSDFDRELSSSDIIIISINSQNLRSFLSGVDKDVLHKKIFVLSMKGIEAETGKRLSQVACECGVNKNDLAVWLGPGHIQEFVAGRPNCMVIDSANKSLITYLADLFKSDVIRFYYGEDLIGNEIGAAAKNVFGICAGMLDGAGLTTLKGALMARGAREIARLIKAMGGKELSAYGLCHLGDYETTLFSKFSNNRAYGEAYYKNEKFIKLAEGVSTTRALKLLGELYGVDLPITNAMFNILYNECEPIGQLNALFARSTRNEFYY